MRQLKFKINMNLYRIIFFMFFILFYSCDKKIDKEVLVKEIEAFSGLKINPNSIDSISYNYDISYRDDVTTYVLYLSDSDLRKLFLESRKKDGFEFYSHMDSLSSFSKEKDNCLKQVNINLTQKWIVYGSGCN